MLYDDTHGKSMLVNKEGEKERKRMYGEMDEFE
jgi:hypothetical protein